MELLVGVAVLIVWVPVASRVVRGLAAAIWARRRRA